MKKFSYLAIALVLSFSLVSLFTAGSPKLSSDLPSPHPLPEAVNITSPTQPPSPVPLPKAAP